jgi:AcrR family transcriptional regulator
LGEAVVRRTQSQRRSEAERRVLDAAITLIAQHGSRAVSLAQVGEAAGFSRGIVNHHFGSRERLLEAVVRDAQQFDIPTVEGGLEQLLTLVRAYLLNISGRTPAARAFLQLWAEAIAADPVLMPLFAERDRTFRSQLTRYVTTGIADGSIRTTVDPAAAAVLVVGLLRGIGMQFIATPPPANPRKITEQAVLALHHAYAAPSVDGPPSEN